MRSFEYVIVSHVLWLCLPGEKVKRDRKKSVVSCLLYKIQNEAKKFIESYPEPWSKLCDVIVSASKAIWFLISLFLIGAPWYAAHLLQSKGGRDTKEALVELFLGKFSFLVCSSQVFQPNRHRYSKIPNNQFICKSFGCIFIYTCC